MANQASGVVTREGGVEIVSELKAGKYGTAAKARLYLSSFAPGPSNVYADFVSAEATYAGYLALAVVWGPVGVDGGGNATMSTGDLFYQATDASVPNVIGGIWIDVTVSSGPSVDKCVEYYPFAAPVPMTHALSFINATVLRTSPLEPGYCVYES